MWLRDLLSADPGPTYFFTMVHSVTCNRRSECKAALILCTHQTGQLSPSHIPSSPSCLALNLAAAFFLQTASPSPRQTSAHCPLHRSLCLAEMLRERLSESSKATQIKYAGPGSQIKRIGNAAAEKSLNVVTQRLVVIEWGIERCHTWGVPPGIRKAHAPHKEDNYIHQRES